MIVISNWSSILLKNHFNSSMKAWMTALVRRSRRIVQISASFCHLDLPHFFIFPSKSKTKAHTQKKSFVRASNLSAPQIMEQSRLPPYLCLVFNSCTIRCALPNFYCFKFIFASARFIIFTACFTNHRLPESRKIITFPDDLFYYRYPFSLSRKKFGFSKSNLSLANLFWGVVLTIFRFSDQAEMPAKPDSHPKCWSGRSSSQRLRLALIRRSSRIWVAGRHETHPKAPINTICGLPQFRKR